MKAGICTFLSVLAAASVQGFDLRPLVCFVGEKAPDGLVAKFDSGEKSTIAKIPGLKEKIAAIPPGKRTLEYYLKYRVRLRTLFVSMRKSADVRYALIALTARDVASTSNNE